MLQSNSVRFGLLIAAVGGLLFTLDLPLLRMAGTDKGTLIFVRGIFLFISISVVWFIVNARSKVKLPYLAGWAGLAVMLTNAMANVTLISANTITTTANVAFIIALVPLLTAVFSRLFIKEPVHLVTWAATIFALEGVGVIVWDSLRFGNAFGDFLALVCACCTAAAFTIIRASKKNVATSLALGSLISAVFAYFIMPVDLTHLSAHVTLGANGWVWLALNGLVVIPLASTLIANAPRFLPSADVSMFFLLETLLAPVWVWMIFSEKPSWAVVVGGTVVVATLLAHSGWRLSTTLRSVPRARFPAHPQFQKT
jgi:drug/metabolite transporter (DMT)-like permease